MIYGIQYSVTALNDLRNIINYVSKTLGNPKSAKELFYLISNSIGGLCSFPERYPLIKGKITKKFKDRKMPIKNYVVIYNVNETKHLILIVRIMNCLINKNV